MLHITDLTYRIGDRLLFDHATLGIPAGHKVGLVGRNGTGKSTLIRMILGETSPESGQIFVRPTARIGHVAQEAPADDRSLIETVLDSNAELAALTREAETATDPERIAAIHTRLADIEAHKAEARAASILKGLGFDEDAQTRPTRTFSGGWRMRVALASVLFNAPDLLLLDEPTNYLDLEGVIWLENFLRTYPYTVVIVSHDRDLLNNAVGHIAHLENGKLNLYTGGYDRFEELRRQWIERQMALKSRQEAERRRIQSFVDRFRAKPNKAAQAQSRVKMLEKMQPIATMVASQTIPFDFPKPEPLSSPLVLVEDADIGYDPDTPVLKGINARLDMDDRIALLGANGNGKSTFARLLAGRLKPLTGRVRKPRALTVGYFAQHQLEELNPAATPLDHLWKLMGEAPETRVRTRLGSFGFSADKADRPVETLSGGEKARLMFALATFEKPQILIMDEPTNHLDVDSREALAHAINGYDGAVVLISHDRHLVGACADRLWIVEDGDVTRFEGDLDGYRDHLLARRAEARAASRGPKADDPRRSARQDKAAVRKRLEPYRKAVSAAEARIQDLSEKQEKVRQRLADPALYDAGAQARLARFTDAARQVEQALAKAEEDWLDAQEALEGALEAAGDDQASA
ncbi:ABC-F family ATP-binding cassette domain-containing protein [Yunchengibacter salinarum]|uniref:ABC-F family ATP-binding cassette domain-containing protein n=1 Tax=Yunchengibacter salinarum TaxID=3133399 RepID=UPI0035B61CED